MLSFLPPIARGLIASILLGLNTLFWCAFLFLFALIKLLLPFAALRPTLDRILHAIAAGWISGNSAWMWLTQRAHWDVAGFDALSMREWYMVQANHQSWVDILILQHLLNRRIPLLKFFLKQELIYVPVMGLAWWALDFPFMKRHSDAELRRHPEKRFEDIETTRRACEKFKSVPTSVMNFPEGTRFRPEKHAKQQSPHRHLLKPKAGAMALALQALGDRFHSLLDVTVVYPSGAPTFWEFLCGRMDSVIVRAATREIPREFCEGDYVGNSAFRKTFQRWLQAIWEQKDSQISSLLGTRRDTGA